jgi:hypothetical protein
MNKQFPILAAAAAVALAVAGCNSSGGNGSPAIQAGGAALGTTYQVPGISAAVTYSFDLGVVDPTTKKYYVTDRTNKTIDVLDLTNNTITQFKGAFAGCQTTAGVAVAGCLAANGAVDNDASGPDGVDVVGNNIYVGDVNALWIMDKNTGALVKKVAIPSTPNIKRADEGCFDPDDGIYAISTPGADNPFMTMIDTNTQTVIATVVMNDSTGAGSGGLEACFYDSATKKFYVNNDGSTANPRGEVDSFSAAAIVALKSKAPSTVQWLTLAGATAYPLGNCDPTGIAPGPGNDLGVMCRQGGIGEQLTFIILNKTNGSVLATLNAGGGDQITYDATSGRWFLADSRQTATGKSCGGGSATCPLTPKVGIVDGATRTIVGFLDNGNNSHSIAVSPGSPNLVITPFTNNSATGGGAAFPGGGINVFTTR